MLYASEQVLLGIIAAVATGMFVVCLVWGRRLRRFEAELRQQKNMSEFCVAESNSLREEISRMKSGSSIAGGGNGKTLQQFNGAATGDLAHEISGFHWSCTRSGVEDVDDLTRIKGIGAKLNQRLNGLGIFRYSQIAELTREDIEKLDDQLRFKGRIDREKWVEQAKALAERAESGPHKRGLISNNGMFSPPKI